MGYGRAVGSPRETVADPDAHGRPWGQIESRTTRRRSRAKPQLNHRVGRRWVSLENHKQKSRDATEVLIGARISTTTPPSVVLPKRWEREVPFSCLKANAPRLLVSRATGSRSTGHDCCTSSRPDLLSLPKLHYSKPLTQRVVSIGERVPHFSSKPERNPPRWSFLSLRSDCLQRNARLNTWSLDGGPRRGCPSWNADNTRITRG